MKEICIFVIGHCPFKELAGEGYQTLQVGGGETFSQLRDNIGDNISQKNPLYCELTGLYWGWKNYSEGEILGLVHYRRYFIRHSIGARSFQEDILRAEDIHEIFRSHDVILQVPSLKNPVSSNMLYENLPEEKQNLSLRVLRNIISSRYPEDLASFDAVAFGYRLCHGNMFAARRELFCEYCSWLFDVLERYEAAFTALGEEIEPRQCGYLGEYLLTVFMHSRIERERIYYCPSALLTGEKEAGHLPIPYPVKNVLRILIGPAADRLRDWKSTRRFEQERINNGLPYDQEIMNGRKYGL